MRTRLTPEDGRQNRELPVNQAGNLFWKRALDLSLIVIFLPILSLVAGAVALCIRLCSRGPVLFKQERVGFGGQSFVCLKFRTMKLGADETPHKNYLSELMRQDVAMTKMDVQGDSRLIPFGALLRATGLDELPQLINVWRGEMSLVGPRPCLLYEYEEYSDWAKRRFMAMPGLTGLWQVSGKNQTTFLEMIQLDVWYAEHKSLWLDLKILARTIPALVLQVVETHLATRSLARQRLQKAT
jgi:lipopolysaccharide/colanic/teichoic acid biosynthesis glycosyltransferase